MKWTPLFLLPFLLVGCLAVNTYYPVALRVGLKQYVLFGPRFLAFTLPNVVLIVDKVYGTDISFPPIYTHSGNVLYFGNGKGGHFEIDVNGYTLSESTVPLPDGGAPASGYLQPSYLTTYCVTEGTTKYCFVGGNPAVVTKTVGTTVTSVPLNITLDATRFLRLDSANGILYVTGQRLLTPKGASQMVAYAFSVNPFAIKYGPTYLIHTADTGCTTPARQCTDDTLLYMDAGSGVISYIFGNSVPVSGGDPTFRITLESFTFSPCQFANATIDDAHLTVPPVIKLGACQPPQPQLCNGTSVCGVKDLCCQDYKTGRRCYNPLLAACVVDEDLRTVLCGVHDGACNGICYDARHYACVNGALKFTG